jgi:predicted ribosome quality control (RQC) complex YloA/Tae2 family protein
VEGDPRERWLGLVFERRAITGRMESLRLSFQAIPGRSGIRADVLDGPPGRLGLGVPFAAGAPQPDADPPPLLRWRQKWGADLEAAMAGERPEVLEGEGDLLSRHRAWSMLRAETLVLQPIRAALGRKIAAEETRLHRLTEALTRDRARHTAHQLWKAQAQHLSAELYRLKGQTQEVQLLDGTLVHLPQGKTAEEAVQVWFSIAKKAERGLARVAELEAELSRERAALAQRLAQAQGNDGLALEAPPKRQTEQRVKGKVSAPSKGTRKMDAGGGKRKDGKGNAFRSVMIDGFEVLIGKGDAENDQLTFKVADNLDFWLHVASVPGSHVVIRNPDKLSELPRQVIERAAELAAFHSKARDGGKVEVHLARIADISKPRGFAPGKVILKKWVGIRVYPKA